MRLKSAITLAIVLVITAAVAFVATKEINVGYYKLKPWGPTIQQGLDLAGGMSAVYEAKQTSGLKATDLKDRMTRAVAVFRKRLDGQGYTEATITLQGTTGIRVDLPGVKNEQAVFDLIGTPAHLQFKNEAGDVILEGKEVVSAKKAQTSATKWVVDFVLSTNGAKLFEKATKENLNKTISIVVDGQTISSPKVNAVIAGGSGIIEGDFTEKAAETLATQIESGALPINLQQSEIRTVSPTLGKNALDSSLLAGLIGFIVVAVLMISIYRLPGLAAAYALIAYILMLLFVLATMPGVQLSLPGIAGILLSIGMAVDANVIVFERFREECASGKTLQTAMDIGFKRALSAIIDSNLTTIIAAGVLYYFGTGSIRGFAITLFWGVCISMISALFVTQFVIRRMIGLGLKNPAFYVVLPKKHHI